MINLLEGFNGIQKKNARVILAILLLIILLLHLRIKL
jgi:hypothetical protein